MYNPAITSLTAPPVAIVQNWIDSYDRRYGDLIDLSQAVPGYRPHPDIISALIDTTADQASLSYGAIEGEDSLRQAYADEMSRLYGAGITRDQIVITSGCNQAFIISALTIAGHGDEILMTEPGYFNHDTSLAMLGITTGRVKTSLETGFIPSIQNIQSALTAKTKALALVSPNNPTGAIYPADQLNDIMDFCHANDIWLIVDETYRDFMAQDIKRHQLLSHEGKDRLILLYSFSKAYCIPGHRLGAICTAEETVAEMAKVMDNIQICAPRAAQQAMARVIAPLRDWREKNNLEMAARADAFKTALDQTSGFEIAALGAYFGYVRHPFKDTSLVTAERMARQVGILTIPGDFFGDGQNAYLRFAFANANIQAIKAIPQRLNALEG